MSTARNRRTHALQGFGGIAYQYISDTYVALFFRFIPCGVWEAVHLIEGLLANDSDIQLSTVHPTPRARTSRSSPWPRCSVST